MKIKIHTKIQKALIHNSWTSYLAQKKIPQLTRTIVFASILIFLSSNLFAQKSNATTSSNSITSSNTATNNTSALNSSSPHPDAFSQIAVKSFADELFLQGFFDEAETEYRRYLFITNAAGTKNTDSSKNMTENSTNADSESAISALSSIYNSTNNISGAKWLFNNFFFDSTVNSTPNLQEQNLQENLLKLYSRLVFAERNYDDFSSLFETANPFINNFSTEVQFILPFSQKLLAHDISGALQICKTTKTPLTNSIMSENLSNLLKSCSSYKTKSPGLALFLSSIFPGAGRWYTGSLRGGFSSFIYVGSFTAGTVYSAIKFGWQDWRPYTFGTVAVCFYAAELYGAYKSAQRYNQFIYNTICKQTDKFYEEIY